MIDFSVINRRRSADRVSTCHQTDRRKGARPPPFNNEQINLKSFIPKHENKIIKRFLIKLCLELTIKRNDKRRRKKQQKGTIANVVKKTLNIQQSVPIFSHMVHITNSNSIHSVHLFPCCTYEIWYVFFVRTRSECLRTVSLYFRRCNCADVYISPLLFCCTSKKKAVKLPSIFLRCWHFNV